MTWNFLQVTVPATLLALVYNALCGLAGFSLCRLILGRAWTGRFASMLTVVVLALTLGQAVLGAVWQTLAAVGLFRAFPVGLIVAFILVAGLAARWGSHAALPDVKALPSKERVPWYALILFLALGYVLWTTWYCAFGWPDGDAMAFYLAQPKLIAHIGRFVPVADYESFAQISLFAEMHSAVMYLVSGEMAARAWLWQAGVLLALGVGALCLEVRLPSGAAVLGAAIVLTSSAVTFVMTDGKTDHVAAAWSVGALLAALVVDWQSPWRPAFLAGLLGGLAVLSKLSLILGLPLVLAIVVVDRLLAARSDRRISVVAGRLAAVGAVAACAALLAFATLALKNQIAYGEPFAPFVYLRGGHSEMLNQVWYSPENTRWILLTYPLALVFGKYPMQHGNLSPLLLAFAPLLLLAWHAGARLPRAAVTLSFAGLAGLAVWMALRPSILAPRYVLPVLLCFVPLLAGAADGWLRRAPAFVTALVVAALAGAVVLLDNQANRNWPITEAYATGRKPDALLLAGASLVENAAPGARFLVASYYKSFLAPEALVCTLGMDAQQKLVTPPPATTTEMWASLYRNGVTDVLIYRPTHPLLLGQKPEVETTPPWLKVTEETYSPAVSVFRLRPDQGAPPHGPGCNAADVTAARAYEGHG